MTAKQQKETRGEGHKLRPTWPCDKLCCTFRDKDAYISVPARRYCAQKELHNG